MTNKKRECCFVEGCAVAARSRGMCNSHYLGWWRHGDPLARRTRPRGLSLEEALAWYLPEPQRTERGCVVGWTGPRRNSDARPKLSFRQSNRYAAAWVCELTHGPQPGPGWEAAHFCNNSECLEPTHITWKTKQENMSDRFTRERAWHRLEDELGGGTAVLIAAIERYGEAA